MNIIVYWFVSEQMKKLEENEKARNEAEAAAEAEKKIQEERRREGEIGLGSLIPFSGHFNYNWID